MNRREAISSVALLLGGTLIGAEAFLSGCKTSDKGAAGFNLSKDDIAFLNEVGETILPATATPGAKEAKVGEFMSVYVKDCYEEKDQTIFLEGFKKLDEAAKKKSGKTFLESTPETKEYQKAKKDTDPNHYFKMMNELTLLGFFTSEVGATKALRYVAVPGKYEGCIPYKKGDKAWAT